MTRGSVLFSVFCVLIGKGKGKRICLGQKTGIGNVCGACTCFLPRGEKQGTANFSVFCLSFNIRPQAEGVMCDKNGREWPIPFYRAFSLALSFWSFIQHSTIKTQHSAAGRQSLLPRTCTFTCTFPLPSISHSHFHSHFPQALHSHFFCTRRGLENCLFCVPGIETQCRQSGR